MAELTGVFNQPFAEQVAFFRNKLGNLVPTNRWDDLWKQQHDTAFMVAGAKKADLLSALAASIDKAITKGTSLGEFREDFKQAVATTGWKGWTGEGSAAGVAWRTRVIYQTNMATSWAAGRYAQLQEGGFEYWVYHHSGAIRSPRLNHLQMDGLVLPADDPLWSTIYPPQGYGCECYVTGAHSERGARRQGGNPDKPVPKSLTEIDEATGTPAGIAPGWDYAPGASVATHTSLMARKLKSYPEPLAADVIRSMAGSTVFADWLEQPTKGSAWPLLVVPSADAAAVGIKGSGVALLSEETVIKQKRRHAEIGPEDYIYAQSVVNEHTAKNVVANKGRDGQLTGTQSITYVQEMPDNTANGGYVLVVKATRARDELFVTSYYRLSVREAKRDSEIRRLLKK